MKYYKKTTVLIIKWIELPEYLQDIIAERDRFQNDSYLEHYSEFEPGDYAKGISVIEDYWKDQVDTNDYKKERSLKDFIKDYNLELDVWLIEYGIDWTDIEMVLIKICW